MYRIAPALLFALALALVPTQVQAENQLDVSFGVLVIPTGPDTYEVQIVGTAFNGSGQLPTTVKFTGILTGETTVSPNGQFTLVLEIPAGEFGNVRATASVGGESSTYTQLIDTQPF